MPTRLGVVAVLAVILGWANALAVTEGGDEKLARNLAALLVAGRAVVAQNQALINDPAKGAKGFTPAAFGAAVEKEYKAKTGVDLAALDPSRPNQRRLKALFDAEKQVVAEAQATIDLPGMGFKGFTPAVFGRYSSEKFAAATGLRIKQTSAKYRNPANQPDAFESRMLAKLADPRWEKGKGYAEVVTTGGTRELRYVQPLYVTAPCLSCHGDPKGELDVAGRAKEGYREGELRGAVSVTVPLSP